MRFYHCVDLGIFIFVKDNGNGTGLFRKERDFNDPHPARINQDEVNYPYDEMTKA